MTAKETPSKKQIEERVAAEADLVERYATSGDPELLGELMEKVTGAKVKSVTRRERPTGRQAAAG